MSLDPGLQLRHHDATRDLNISQKLLVQRWRHAGFDAKRRSPKLVPATGATVGRINR
jgi:hypothetical protein